MLQETVIEWRDSWLEEGRQEGEATFLLRQLEDKFGRLPNGVLSRVRSANSEELIQWGRRVLTESSLEKILAP